MTGGVGYFGWPYFGLPKCDRTKTITAAKYVVDQGKAEIIGMLSGDCWLKGTDDRLSGPRLVYQVYSSGRHGTVGAHGLLGNINSIAGPITEKVLGLLGHLFQISVAHHDQRST